MLYEIRYIRRSLSALRKTGASGLIAMIPAILILLSSCSGKAIGDAQDFSPNNPPQIDAVSVTNLDGSAVDPAKIEPFASFKVTVTASDPDSDVLSYSFNSDCGSFSNVTSTATGCTSVFKTGSITGGQKLRLSAKTSDTKGGHASRSYDIGSGKTGPTISAVFDTIHIQPDGKVTLTLSANCSGFYQIVPDGTSISTVDFNKDMMLYKFSADTPTQCTIAGPTCVSGATAQLPAKVPYDNNKYYNITIVFRDGLFQSDTFEQLLYVDGEKPCIPDLSSTFPETDSYGIPLTPDIYFTFSESMDPTSFSASNLSISVIASSGSIGTIKFVEYNESMKRAAFSVNGLSKCAKYSVELTGVRDLAGNPLEEVLNSIAFCTVGYAVSYDGNGNTYGAVPTAGNAWYLNDVSLPGKDTCALFKQVGSAYYGFKGWATTSNATVSDVLTSPYKPTSDITLYAVWSSLAVGDRGPAGGWIFYDAGIVKSDSYGEWRYLEAASDDVHNLNWSNITNLYAGTSVNVGFGKSNTELILNQSSNYDGSYAYACINYNSSDWYLPSLDELKLIHQELYLRNIGSFVINGTYVSSSEFSNVNYYGGEFRTGFVQLYYAKTGIPEYFVRPVRRFK